MKFLMMFMLVFGGAEAMAKAGKPKSKSPEKICSALEKRAEANCTEDICKEWIEQGDDCPGDDFQELLQGCMEDEFDLVISNYNKKHGTKLTCAGD